MSEVLTDDELEPPSVLRAPIEGIPYGAHNLTGSRRERYAEVINDYIGRVVVAHVYDIYFKIPGGSDDSLPDSVEWQQVEIEGVRKKLTGTLTGSADPTELILEVDGSEFSASATGLVIADEQRAFIPLQFLEGLYPEET